LQIDIDLIEPSPYQPRTRFREEALDELARSIQSSGIIQPLVVRPIGNRYQLIAGERRWRAAHRAGLNKVTAIVRQVPDELALEMTLVENIQREDLNAIEQARAFERLMDEFHATQEAVADRTGKDRTTVANAIRLLKLEPTIQDWIEEGKLTAGHGRALLAVPDSQLRMRYAQRAAALQCDRSNGWPRAARAEQRQRRKPNWIQIFAKRWKNCSGIWERK
jgi:ParB family chromosome partitioning protein